MFKFFYDIYAEIAFVIAALLYVVLHWQTDTSHLLGVPLTIVSLIFWIKARTDLGSAYSILPQTIQLVTTGIYTRIRHPMYLFSTLALLGLVIAFEKPFFYTLPVVIGLVQILRACSEDIKLAARFGSSFADYKKRMWL